MKGKKLLRYWILICALSVLLIGCAQNNNDEDGRKDRPRGRKKAALSEQVTESSEEPESTEEPEPEPEPEPAAEVTGLLHPIITSHTGRYYGDTQSLELLELRWDDIALEGEEEEAFPALAEELRKMTAEQEKQALQEVDFDLEYAAEYAEDYEYTWGIVFEYENSVKLMRCDDTVFSFARKYYSFTGGAHGMYGYGGYIYDTKTGKLLGVQDLVTDPDRLADAIYQQVLMEYGSEEGVFNPDDLPNTIKEYVEQNTLNMVFTNRGLRVYFNPYEIGPYSSGIFAVDLYEDLYPDLVKPEYANFSNDWIMELSSYESIAIDINLDGVLEKIGYMEDSYYDEGYGFSMIDAYTVYAGYEEILFKTEAFSSKGYLIKKGNDYYLQIFQEYANTPPTLYVVKLTNGAPELMTEESGIDIATGHKSQEYSVKSVPEKNGFFDLSIAYGMTDPENLHLEEWTMFMGMAIGSRMYRLDGSGIPVPQGGQKIFEITGAPIEFEVLQDVTGQLLDEEGLEAEDYTISAGGTVQYIRTDNATFGEVLTADGKTVRIYMEKDGYSNTINGVPLEEVFFGAFFDQW